MKSIILACLAAFLLIFVSCKKTNEPKRPNSQFSFMGNDTRYEFNGSLYAGEGCIIQKSWWSPLYAFFGQSDIKDSYLIADLNTTKIETGTYQVTFRVHLNKVYYDSSRNCTVTITSINNNLANGIFSGEVFQIGTTNAMLISNGSFKDVLIRLE